MVFDINIDFDIVFESMRGYLLIYVDEIGSEFLKIALVTFDICTYPINKIVYCDFLWTGNSFAHGISIATSVQIISSRAFASCRDLENVTIPTSVSAVGQVRKLVRFYSTDNF